jgi:hypothetical protein
MARFATQAAGGALSTEVPCPADQLATNQNNLGYAKSFVDSSGAPARRGRRDISGDVRSTKDVIDCSCSLRFRGCVNEQLSTVPNLFN